MYSILVLILISAMHERNAMSICCVVDPIHDSWIGHRALEPSEHWLRYLATYTKRSCSRTTPPPFFEIFAFCALSRLALALCNRWWRGYNTFHTLWFRCSFAFEIQTCKSLFDVQKLTNMLLRCKYIYIYISKTTHTHIYIYINIYILIYIYMYTYTIALLYT